MLLLPFQTAIIRIESYYIVGQSYENVFYSFFEKSLLFMLLLYNLVYLC